MDDIFISYARADKQQAALLATKLKEQGWSVWWDREIPPGRAFDEVIEEAINAAKCVIVLWSQKSIASQWVKTEAAEGAAKNSLIPVLIEKVSIPLAFKQIEAADLTDWQGKSSHPEFNHLVNTIDKKIHSAASTRIKPTFIIKAKERLYHWWRMTLKLLALTLGLAALVFVVIALNEFGVFAKLTGANLTNNTPIAPPASNLYSNPTSVEKPNTANLVVESIKQIPKKVLTTRINLFPPENGVQLLVASSDAWMATIDGKEDSKTMYYALGKEAVYGFKNDQSATFDKFSLLISESDGDNIKEFELLAGNISPTGAFESIGKFQTQNVKLFKTPYQEFNFTLVTAKYLKFKLLSIYRGDGHPDVQEFQLFGNLQ